MRANLAAFARQMTHEVGFDGVQLNVEPLSSGSEAFLLLLESVREAMGPEKILSAAGHKWAPSFAPLLDRISSYWRSG